MSPLEPLYYVAALALIVGGIVTIRDPVPVLLALKSVGSPVTRPWAYLLAAWEIFLGFMAIVSPVGGVAVVMGATYLLYALFAMRARIRSQTCGCYGSVEPPSTWHIGFDLAAGLGCILVVVFGVSMP